MLSVLQDLDRTLLHANAMRAEQKMRGFFLDRSFASAGIVRMKHARRRAQRIEDAFRTVTLTWAMTMLLKNSRNP